MDSVLLKTSHEDLFLEQGWLLALGFKEGWACFRTLDREWSNLEPYALGAVAAAANLAAYNEIMDTQSRRYLQPHEEGLIYHTFWGVTPKAARMKVQYPPREDLGSMLAVERSETDDVGYIDGYISPFRGPFSKKTELFTVKEKYPAFQVYNPLPDAMNNVMMRFDQMQYTYDIVKDKDLIKNMLVGGIRVKKYTMGHAWPSATTIPKWLQDLVGLDLLSWSLKVMEGRA
jgi:hypothetical protein